jgi:hypothetical protein
MNEMIAALRRAAQDELPSLEASPAAAPITALEPFEEALAAFFSTQPPTAFWLAVIEEVATFGTIEDSPAGLAAATAKRPPPARPITVEEAIALPLREARAHLQVALRIGTDAAEELLERPAAALARRTPAEVRDLAGLARRPAGQLFADIASSWRSSSGHVYAYRPGVEDVAPAESGARPELPDLVAWGEQLLG